MELSMTEQFTWGGFFPIFYEGGRKDYSEPFFYKIDKDYSEYNIPKKLLIPGLIENIIVCLIFLNSFFFFKPRNRIFRKISRGIFGLLFAYTFLVLASSCFAFGIGKELLDPGLNLPSPYDLYDMLF
jgi:hypothetical protein